LRAVLHQHHGEEDKPCLASRDAQDMSAGGAAALRAIHVQSTLTDHTDELDPMTGRGGGGGFTEQ